MHTEDKAVLPAVVHGTASIVGLNIAYRAAGDPKIPKVVLLHGWPASSHQYRNVIPALAGRFHVISPDCLDLIAKNMCRFYDEKVLSASSRATASRRT